MLQLVAFSLQHHSLILLRMQRELQGILFSPQTEHNLFVNLAWGFVLNEVLLAQCLRVLPIQILFLLFH